MIHNIRLGMQKMMQNDPSLYGWEAEYDFWLKEQIEKRNFKDLINYADSHRCGLLAAPMPDHYVPSLYSLGLMDNKDEISFFFGGEESLTAPAFGERSFLIDQV